MHASARARENARAWSRDHRNGFVYKHSSYENRIEKLREILPKSGEKTPDLIIGIKTIQGVEYKNVYKKRIILMIV